jgi:hypothetical protein
VEHFGANDREQWQMDAFQDVVMDCGFCDLGYHGLPCTWYNKKEGVRNVKARLDRAFGDGRFMDAFGDSAVQHIQLVKSDHCGLLITARSANVADRRQGSGRHKPFRCEGMWFRHEKYKDFVNQVWDPGQGAIDLTSIYEALWAMQGELRGWEKEVFGSVKKRIKETWDAIEMKQSNTLYRGCTKRERELVDGLT